MSEKKNPIVGVLVSGLLAGIPDLISAIREKRAAKKAEKLAKAGTGLLTTTAATAAVVDGEQLLTMAASQVQDTGIYLPPELMALPPEHVVAYIAAAAIAIALKAYAHYVALAATQP